VAVAVAAVRRRGVASVYDVARVRPINKGRRARAFLYGGYAISNNNNNNNSNK